jgi:hypothetical protein
MKLLTVQNHRNFTHLLLLLLISSLYSCEQLKKLEDIFAPPPTYKDESAQVVYDWYKMIARVQLPASPQPVILLNNRNFGYIGVGLCEAVRPGIKGAMSLSSKLLEMLTMPQPDSDQKYVWGAVANAALASMYKQFLVGLTSEDILRIDSMENAYNNNFKLTTSDSVSTRSQAYGRLVATAIYNWSTSDNFNLSGQAYILPTFPGAWVPIPLS